MIRADDRAVAEALWAARRAVSPATRKIKPHKIAEDVAVPRSKLPEFVGRLGQIGREMGLTVASYGHAGDGNVHVNVLFERQDEADRAQETVARIMRTCLDLGGTLSGEHGIGTTKAPFLHWELSPLEIELLVRLKKVFDPNGILNPGKIFHLAAAHVAETETGGD